MALLHRRHSKGVVSPSQEAWSQASGLFQQLAGAPPDQRDRILAEQPSIPEDARGWLDDLLVAHDEQDHFSIDRRVEDLVRVLGRAADLPAGESFIGQLFGPWRADARLGTSVTGRVFAGSRQDGQFDLPVVIKVLDLDARSDSARILVDHEVRALARLDHPGIARLIDGGVREDGVAWVVMEHVNADPLDIWCDKRALSTKEKLELFEQVADAVSYCHRELVAHGDIKPSNVLVDERGWARLVDFGMTAGLTDPWSDGSESRNGCGCSPGYASPERLGGARPSIADDVFALGAMLFRLLSGQGIRSAPEQTRLVESGTNQPPDVSEKVRHQFYNVDLCAIVLKTLESEPRERYQSVEALINDIERWKRGFPLAGRSHSNLYRLECWIGRHTSLAVSGMVVAVALVGGLSLALWQADRAERAALIAEAAEVRAQSASRFLAEMLKAELPTESRDSISTLRPWVDRGIERARAPETGPRELRAQLLVTLAEILLSWRQFEEAEALAEEARSLLDPPIEEGLGLRLSEFDVELSRQRNQPDPSE